MALRTSRIWVVRGRPPPGRWGQQGAEDLPLGIGQVGLVEGPRLRGRGPGRARWLVGAGHGGASETGVGVEESQQPLPTSLLAECSPKAPKFPNPLSVSLP